MLCFHQESLFEALASTNEETRRVLNSRDNPEKYKDNLAKAVIYYEEFNYESITEKEAYLVSDVDYILFICCKAALHFKTAISHRKKLSESVGDIKIQG